MAHANDYHPCACGCGELARGSFKVGHRPIVSYRSIDGERLHRVRAELTLGKPLPARAVVHHVEGDKGDFTQLVICQDQAYHRLLHARTRIVRAGGHPDIEWLCSRCKSLRPLTEFRYREMSGRKKLVPICQKCRRIVLNEYRYKKGLRTRGRSSGRQKKES